MCSLHVEARTQEAQRGPELEEEEGGGEPASEEQQEEQEETGREEETLQWNLPGWSVPMLLVLLGHVLHPGCVIHVLSPVFSTRLLSEQTRTNCYNWVITPVIIYFLSYQLSLLLSFSPSVVFSSETMRPD